MRKSLFVVVAVLLAAVVVSGCGGSEPGEEQDEHAGALEFRANGEDFAREGFTSKDGWNIPFEHIYVNLAEVTAYQADPPYDAEEGGEVEAVTEARLPGTHTVDLAEGDGPVPVGEVESVPAGHYNAISWKMVNAEEGPAEGYSLVVSGQAEKDGRTIDFAIKDDTEYKYTGGEYVGDERKGFVEEGEKGELEMTFHFDHLFGDGDVPAGDDINTGAPGLDAFAELSGNGEVEVVVSDLEGMMSAENYEKLKEKLADLGHVGEGHCYSEIIN